MGHFREDIVTKVCGIKWSPCDYRYKVMWLAGWSRTTSVRKQAGHIATICKVCSRRDERNWRRRVRWLVPQRCIQLLIGCVCVEKRIFSSFKLKFNKCFKPHLPAIGSWYGSIVSFRSQIRMKYEFGGSTLRCSSIIRAIEKGTERLLYKSKALSIATTLLSC